MEASSRVVIPFSVEIEDGTRHEGEIRLPDIARTEGKLGISLASFANGAPSFEFLLTSAYFALRRRGHAPDNFDLWFDSVVDFTFKTDDEGAASLGEAAAPSDREAVSTP